MIKIKLINYLLLLIISSVCGCGRFYEKNYTYIPPETSSARACILACRDQRESCEHTANKAYQECLRTIEQTSMLNYNIDLNTNTMSRATIDRNNLEQCRSTQKSCEQTYNSCYITCGGQVEPNRFSSISID